MREIKLGQLFGCQMVLKDVPEERATYIEKLAIKHLERMNDALTERTFGAFRNDLEIAKTL